MTIRTSEKTDLFFPAFCAARADVRPAAKTGRNKFQNYDYATEEDWHEAIMPGMLAHGLVLVFSAPIVESLGERTTQRGGTEYVFQVRGVARLTHTSGQWVEVDGAGQGQDNADKGLYKALTGMKKYLYALLFALPTSDDPEGDEGVGQTAAPPAAPRNPPTKAAPKPPPSPPGPPATWAACLTPAERSAYIEGALSRAKGDAAKLNTVGEFLQAHASGFDPARFAELCKLAATLLTQAKPAADGEVLL